MLFVILSLICLVIMVAIAFAFVIRTILIVGHLGKFQRTFYLNWVSRGELGKMMVYFTEFPHRLFTVHGSQITRVAITFLFIALLIIIEYTIFDRKLDSLKGSFRLTRVIFHFHCA